MPLFQSSYLGQTAASLRYNDADNAIINGAFDIWQRGASFNVSGVYTADRWRHVFSTGSISTTREAFTIGDKLGDNNPTFFLRNSVSGQSGTGAFCNVQQRIESVKSYAGETITIMGWAKRASGTGNMAIDWAQGFGTGGSPSTSIAASAGQTVTLTTSWAPFAVTFDIPSVTGKTLGSDGNDCLILNFWSSAGTDFAARTNSLGIQTIAIDLWGVHIRKGTHSTAITNLYRTPNISEEFLKCQRFYRTGNINEGGAIGTKYAVGAASGGSAYFNSSHVFNPPMRGTLPDVTITSTPTYTNCSNIVVSGQSVNGFTTRVDITGAGIFRAISATWTADAEI